MFEQRVKSNGQGIFEDRIRDFETILNKKIDNKFNYKYKPKETKKLTEQPDAAVPINTALQSNNAIQSDGMQENTLNQNAAALSISISENQQ